jgi:hypothetical protein
MAHILLKPRNLPLYITFALLLAVLGNSVFELLKGAPFRDILLPMSASAAGVIALSIYFSPWFQGMRKRSAELIRVIPDIGPPVPAVRGLVAFVAVGQGSSSALQAAEWHGERGKLQRVWLLTSTSKAAADDARRVKAEIEAKFPNLAGVVIEELPDMHDIKLIKARVEEVRRRAINSGVPEEGLICDFTGLTKSASAGMILACLPRNCRLEYMHPRRIDADGRADPAAGSDPMEVRLAYELEEEEEA